jgi:alkylation response protein AidB-like acyl-CoA dehydrogenase
MDLNFSAQDETFRQQLRSWLERNVTDEFRMPQLAFMHERGAEDWERRLRWHRKLYEAGWVGISWPKEYGGRGASQVEQLIYEQELGRAGCSRPVNTIGIMMAGPTLMHWGSAEQKQRYIPKILAAEEIWCQGFSEPGAGSDLASVITRAVDQGDYFALTGQKIWTSDAHHADMCILLARTDPAAPKHRGLSFLLVDMHSPGVTVRPLVQITGDRSFNEVFFDEVKVPKANLLGQKNQGWQVAITTLMYERVGVGGGGTTAEVGELVQLAKVVERTGRPAWREAYVRQKLAQFAIEARALRYTGYRQLTRRLKGRPPGPEGSIMKLAASELNLRMCSFALELLGSYGQFALDAPYSLEAGRWPYRMLAARALTIGGGTSEVQHNIIGERVLGLPKG